MPPDAPQSITHPSSSLSSSRCPSERHALPILLALRLWLSTSHTIPLTSPTQQQIHPLYPIPQLLSPYSQDAYATILAFCYQGVLRCYIIRYIARPRFHLWGSPAYHMLAEAHTVAFIFENKHGACKYRYVVCYAIDNSIGPSSVYKLPSVA